MKAHSARWLLYGAATWACLLQQGPAFADPPICTNAKWVKATIADCGDVHISFSWKPTSMPAGSRVHEAEPDLARLHPAAHRLEMYRQARAERLLHLRSPRAQSYPFRRSGYE